MRIQPLFFLAVLFFYFFMVSLSSPTLLQKPAGVPHSASDLIDLAGLNQEGPDWRILFQDLGQDKGHIKLSQVKWLMYFLHWRPLTEANKTITVEYVQNHLLNFWDQAMNFKLTNVDGKMEICGHEAYFTEGIFANAAVATRFIVWNCPETGRQFTADCNINLQR